MILVFLSLVASNNYVEEHVSPEVSQGSLDLQSNVLPLSYRPLMEAFFFPFLFLEVSLALGAINGYGKNKKAMLLPRQT